MFSFVPEFTHPYQNKIERILPSNVLEQLQATNCGNTVIEYMEAMATQSYHQFVDNKNSLRSYNKYQLFWKKFSVSQKDDEFLSTYREKILLKKLNQYVEYVNGSMPKCMTDIEQIFVKEKLSNDVSYSQSIEDRFVSNHNGLMKKLEKNRKGGIKHAIDCMRQHTTQRQYKFWRKKVYKRKKYILCVCKHT